MPNDGNPYAPVAEQFRLAAAEFGPEFPFALCLFTDKECKMTSAREFHALGRLRLKPPSKPLNVLAIPEGSQPTDDCMPAIVVFEAIAGRAGAMLPFSVTKGWGRDSSDGNVSKWLRALYDRVYLRNKLDKSKSHRIVTVDPFGTSADLIEEDFLSAIRNPIAVSEIAKNCPDHGRSDKLAKWLERNGARVEKRANKYYVELDDAYWHLKKWAKWHKANCAE